MARCELSGKGPVVKNLVSHSNIKTKSVAFPNVQQKRMFSKALNRLVSLKMATSTIRDMEHMGGLDIYILNQTDKLLSVRALKVKREIQKKIGTKKKSQAAKSGVKK
jgi:large subunit ribosomal protein L28